MLPASDLAAGLAVLLPLLACGILAGHLAARRLAPGLRGAPYLLAVLVGATATLLAAVVIPGAVGLLRPGPMLAVAVAVAAAGARRAPAGAWRLPARTGPDPDDGRAVRLLAAALAGLVAACALAYLRRVTGAPILSIDALNFNLAIPAEWLQQHSLWGLHQFIPDYSNATYPHNGNALLALVMVPFRSTFLAQLVAVPYWAAAGVAAAAVARELGAPRAGAVLAGTAFASIPVVLRAGLEGAQTDLPMLACLGAGVLFCLRHHRTGARGELVLAGLALGIALGTKWYALPSTAVVLALWALGRRRRLVRDGGVLVALLLLASGFWFVRNWVEAGNPLFPQGVPLLLDAPRDPIREAGGWTLAHYLLDGDVWRTFLWPAFRDAFGLAGAVLAAAATAAAVLAVRRRDGRVALVAAGTALLAVAYVVTPYSAFGPEGRPVLAGASTRYGLPALLGAAVLAGWLAGRGPRWAAAVGTGVAAGVLDGLRRFFDLGFGDLAVGSLAAAGLAGLALLARRAPAAGMGGTAVAVVLVTLVAGQRASEQGYAPFDPAFAFIEAHAPEGRRVGVAGTWTPQGVAPPLPAYGRRLGNDVDYVGHFPDGMLRRYRTPGAFARAAAGRDLLLIGTGAPPGSDEREVAWARAAGWRELTRSDRLVLLAR